MREEEGRRRKAGSEDGIWSIKRRQRSSRKKTHYKKKTWRKGREDMELNEEEKELQGVTKMNETRHVV